MGTELELKARDARAALAFAAAVADCEQEAEFADQTEALTGLIGAEGVIVISSRDWMGEAAVEIGDRDVYSAELLAAVDRGWREHPVIVPDLVSGAPGARRLSDFVAARRWRAGGLFNEFYRPLGMGHELSAQLAWGPAGSSCCVAVHRSGRDFGAREMALLAAVTPHLRAARSRLAAQSRPLGPDALLEGGRSAESLARRLPITAREAEVLAQLAEGHTNAGIAYALGISRHTVVRHVEHLYAKLDVHTRAAATRLALEALLEGA